MLFSDFRLGLWNGDRSTVRRGRRPRKLKGRRPGLESLESRLVMATSTWTGAVSNLWSVAGNWQNSTLPATGNDLVFPAGAANLTNTDDLAKETSFGSLMLSGSGYTISGSTDLTFTSIEDSSTSGTNTVSAPITGSVTPTVTVDNSGETLVLAGVISGTAGLNTAGSGTLQLTQANTYTGTTTVQAGMLLVNGAQASSPVTIDSGATLGGTGTVGSITAAGGTLSPGDSAPGILTDSGTLTLDANGTGNASNFAVELNGTTAGTGYTQLQATGPITLTAANLNITLGSSFVAAANQTFTILDNTGSSAINGTFSGLAQGSIVTVSGVSFEVGYAQTSPTANNVVLTELAASSTTLASLTASPVFGQSVSLQATVTGTAGGATPTGNVEFLTGSVSLGTAALSSGVATLAVTSLPVAANSITADYLGDSNYGTSNSPAITVTVAQASASAAVTFMPASPIFGQSVTLTATVAAVSPGAGTPTGTVTFFSGTTSLGTGTLSSGVATLDTTALPAATNSITAQYAGDTNFTGVTSPAVDLAVTQASTTSTVTFAPSMPYLGLSVNLTATIAPVSPGAGTPTGMVEFLDGTTSLGNATLNGSGVAVLPTTALTTGDNSITAKYLGDNNFTTSTSPAVTITVAATASSTTTLTAVPTSSVAGQSVVLTATVAPIAPATGTPTGTVEFFNGSTSLGTGTLNGSGVATLDVTTLPVATNNSITGVYSGDATFSASTSNAVTVTVTKATATNVVTYTPAAPVFGQSVTLTATLAAVSPGGGTPTGTVTFLNGTTSLGTGTLNASGVATLAVGTLPVAANSITAQYAGDSNFAAVTSAAVTVTVAQAATSSTVTSTPASPVFGESVTLTATIAAVSPGVGTPTGTVTFFNGTTSLGTGTLNASGVATLALSTLPVAANSITATYGATTDFATSTSPAVTVTVAQASTTTTLSISPTASVFGQSVTLTATIAAVSPGVGTPTGTVTFFHGTTSLGTGTLNASGVATLAVTSLPVGSDSLTASYGGDTNFVSSTSTSSSFTVSQASTTTTVTLSPVSPTPFEAVTLTATIAVTSPGAGTPTGTVTFFDGTTAIGTGTVNSSGVATLSLTAQVIGTNSITATYSGDTNFATSTSPVVTVVVGTENEQWLNAVYLVDLNRPLSQSDLTIWDQQFTNGRTRTQIALAIGNSKEAQETIVQNAFQLYLNRPAFPIEVKEVIGAAAATHTSARAIILGSHEFFEDSGGTIPDYLAALETAVLGQTVSNAGNLASQLERGVLPAKVAEEVLLSPQGKAALLTDTFVTVLNRQPIPQETTSYVSVMNTNGFYLRDIQAVLLASNEYYDEVVVSLASASTSS